MGELDSPRLPNWTKKGEGRREGVWEEGRRKREKGKGGEKGW